MRLVNCIPNCEFGKNSGHIRPKTRRKVIGSELMGFQIVWGGPMLCFFDRVWVHFSTLFPFIRTGVVKGESSDSASIACTGCDCRFTPDLPVQYGDSEYLLCRSCFVHKLQSGEIFPNIHNSLLDDARNGVFPA